MSKKFYNSTLCYLAMIALWKGIFKFLKKNPLRMACVWAVKATNKVFFKQPSEPLGSVLPTKGAIGKGKLNVDPNYWKYNISKSQSHNIQQQQLSQQQQATLRQMSNVAILGAASVILDLIILISVPLCRHLVLI